MRPADAPRSVTRRGVASLRRAAAQLVNTRVARDFPVRHEPCSRFVDMAMQSEAQVHDPNEQPASRPRARQPAQPAPRPSPRHPDEEAMLLMMKLVQRVEVAKSFAKIAAGLVAATAAGSLKVRYDQARKIARAASDAAVHVAKNRPAAEADVDAEETASD